jgi:hypothetical protein
VANYLAFSSAELANRSVDARRPAGAIVTVISELLPNCYTDFGTANLVVFRSAQELDRFLAAPESFPFDGVTYRYSRRTGELELAV